jgi:ADP-ribosylglycohydrolase
MSPSKDRTIQLPEKERFSGCLIGQCVGDAAGFPAEGHSPEICRRYVNEMLRGGSAEEAGRGRFPFGQYTDDSQLARELLQSYVTCNRFEPQEYARRIAAIFSEERIVGYGRATEEAARRLAQGISWDNAGTPSPSAGNGSAMRAGPVGLISFDDHRLLIQHAVDQGRITHNDERCSAGAVAIAGAVALVLQRTKVNKEEFLLQLNEWTRDISSSVSSFILKLREWVLLPPAAAAERIAGAGLDADYPYYRQGISPFVTCSVLWSLYSFLRTPDDYWETICTAISAGGDTDTTASMAGAISGAYMGLGAIPSSVARRLTDRGTWGYEDLVQLAHKCYVTKMKNIGRSVNNFIDPSGPVC